MNETKENLFEFQYYLNYRTKKIQRLKKQIYINTL